MMILTTCPVSGPEAQFWVQRALVARVFGQICVASSNHNRDFMSSLCCSEDFVLKSEFAAQFFSTDA